MGIPQGAKLLLLTTACISQVDLNTDHSCAVDSCYTKDHVLCELHFIAGRKLEIYTTRDPRKMLNPNTPASARLKPGSALAFLHCHHRGRRKPHLSVLQYFRRKKFSQTYLKQNLTLIACITAAQDHDGEWWDCNFSADSDNDNYLSLFQLAIKSRSKE
ncbi:hypothetical protein PSHT_12950 [Puccinia striiformis]|uniref:Uncharacterized protein n=1 Tax=Puccinia striiformis TaxID=27350 RepID=A0A2S4UTD9_9BASI|nr:hypothetical protein PSHT_12950 [Puccinia striiformis]